MLSRIRTPRWALFLLFAAAGAQSPVSDPDARRVQSIQLQISKAQLDQHAALDQFNRIVEQAQQELNRRLGPLRNAEAESRKQLDAAKKELDAKYGCDVDLDKLACREKASQ